MNILTHRCREGIFSLVLILLMTRVSFAQGWQSEVLSGVTLQDLTSVWTTSSVTPPQTEIFCVGKGGTIIYNNGSGWTLQQSGGNNLNGTWGSLPNNVYAVGEIGTILHYNGSSWTSSHSGGYDLNAVWGSSSTDVYAVGFNGTILHYDGNTWTPQTSGTINSLNAVWGSSASDVFVVGDQFTILHYDGSTWSRFDTTTPQNITLKGIWGYAADSVFAVGEAGTIIWYNGDVWSLLSSEISPSIVLNAVWGASACNVYAVGQLSSSGTIYHFDGSTWSSQENLISPTPSPLSGIHGTSMRDIFAVGNVGTFVSYDLEGDERYPLICQTSPVDGTTEISIDARIIASFPTQMDPDTITAATFTLTDTSSPITGTVSYENGAFAIFTPENNLDYETTYTARIGIDIEDRFGYGIGYDTDYIWSFTTMAEPSSSSASGGCFISAALSWK